MANWARTSLFGILGIAVVGSTLAVGMQADRYAALAALSDAKHLIDAYFVEEAEDQALVDAAIAGMVEELGDPYTVYVPPRGTAEFSKDLTGEYVGIGAEVLMRDGWLTIESPMDGSPAWRAGVMAGDRVVAIEGESTKDKDIDDLVEALMGEPGTAVRITVERADERLDIDVVRDHIKVQQVKGVHRVPGEDGRWSFVLDHDRKIAYVRMTQFTGETASKIRAAYESARDEAGGSISGMILDLRWNPGGLLDEAVGLADLFLEEGVIVSTRGRAFPENVARASASTTLGDFPLAVLINGQSASASEVVAGALVENGRAIAVGTRTFGKGSVQSVRAVGDQGAVLKITEQRYYLPSGRSLHRMDDSLTWGVDPSPGFYVPLEDDQLVELFKAQRAEEILRGPGEASDAEVLDWTDLDAVLERLRDPQLEAAARAVVRKLDTGVWTEEAVEQNVAREVSRDELRQLALARERMLRQLERLDRRYEAVLAQGGDEPIDGVRDLWPDEVDVVGGTVTVRDADGGLVAELAITGPTLERWLVDADVEPRAGGD